MTDQIFISYRRDDAAYVTGHINDLLRKEFGDDSVFTDVDNIALGVDFRAVLDDIVSQCQVVLAVIGSSWLTVRDQEGQPRLQDPADFVRIEIESALKRNIPVIPLLVSGAKMPAPEELPETLQALAFRNGIQIRPAPDFGVDMARLIKNLRRHFDSIRVTDDDSTAAEVIPASEAAPSRRSTDIRPERATQGAAQPASGFSMQVDDDERARKRAELAAQKGGAGKRRGAWLALAAVVGAGAAAWYYDYPIPGLTTSEPAEEPMSIAEPAESFAGDAEAVEQDVDTSANGAVAAETESAAEPATESVADPVMDAIENGPVAVVEEAAEAVGDEGVAASPATEAVEEPADTAVAEVADTPDMVEGEVILSPNSQRKADISELIGEGIRLAAISDHEGAIEIFDQAIEIDAELAFGYRQRAASHRALGNYEAAIADYGEAIRLNDEDVNAYFNRAMSYYAIEDYAAAIADFGAVVERDPEFVDAYLKRADAHEAVGNEEAALQDREYVEQLQSTE